MRSTLRPNEHLWTPGMIAAFRALCADRSLTFREIRDKMNELFALDLTRNACIGKARRLALPPREISNNPAVKEQPVVKIFAPIPPELGPRSLQPFTRTIYQLRDRDCHWPGNSIDGGERPPFYYCGCRALSGMPYCAEHTARAHGTPRPRPIP